MARYKISVTIKTGTKGRCTEGHALKKIYRRSQGHILTQKDGLFSKYAKYRTFYINGSDQWFSTGSLGDKLEMGLLDNYLKQKRSSFSPPGSFMCNLLATLKCYKIAPIIAQQAKPHIVGEALIVPAVKVLKSVLYYKKNIRIFLLPSHSAMTQYKEELMKRSLF